jgi:cell division protein FtsB
MSEQKKRSEPALHDEIVSLKKRVEALEGRVTELEKELREAEEAAPLDL